MLILLPGLICDDAIFEPQVRAFTQAVAFKGYGLESTLTGMARTVLDRALDSFDLLGHSMGGRVAQEILRIAPKRVRKLALISTGVHGVRDLEERGRFALRDLGREKGFDALVDTWLPPMVGPNGRADSILMTKLRDMCLRQDQATFEAQISALLNRADASDLLKTIKCPTLVMTGELDSWSPPQQHEQIAGQIAGAELVIIPGAGHMITLEKPDEVNQAIAEWLARK